MFFNWYEFDDEMLRLYFFVIVDTAVNRSFDNYYNIFDKPNKLLLVNALTIYSYITKNLRFRVF